MTRLLAWPLRRIRDGYRLRDLVPLALARLRGLSPADWEEQLSARETALGVQVMRSTPRTLFLEITGRCPIDCLMCARRYRDWSYGDLTEGVFEALVPIFSRVGTVVLGGFGEPLVARSFDTFFDRLTALGARVALQTSGFRLTPERASQLVAGGLRHLHISIDSPVEETYRSIRPRIEPSEVQDRVREIVRLRREANSPWPTVQVVFVAMQRNIGELPAMVDLVSELGADHLTVQYMVAHSEEVRQESLYYDQELANRMLDAAEARAQEVGLRVELPERFGSAGKRPEQPCTDPWRVTFVRWNGEVRPCCYAPNVAMGNLADTPFWNIWNGPAYRELRRRVNSQDPPSYCLNCSVGRMCGIDDQRAHVALAERSPT